MRKICMELLLIIFCTSLMCAANSVISANVFSSGFLCDSTSQTILRGVIGQPVTGRAESGLSVAKIGFLYVLFTTQTTEVISGYDEHTEDYIFPNPSLDMIHIILGKKNISQNVSNIRIYNVLGEVRIIQSIINYTSGGSVQINIDITFLSPGVYFVNTGKKVMKIIKL